MDFNSVLFFFFIAIGVNSLLHKAFSGYDAVGTLCAHKVCEKCGLASFISGFWSARNLVN
jgi:hypothetical protein